MRTTITLADELVRRVKRESGKARLSEAISDSLESYFRLKNRLSLLDELEAKPLPHDWKRIKSARRGRKWSI